MKLGIIAKAEEKSFINAKKQGLTFIELCVNGGDDVAAFLELIPKLKKWMKQYDVAIGSVGRWKAGILREDGTLEPEEIRIAEQLVKAAALLGSPHYICGCNRVEGISYFDNTKQAIRFFEQVLQFGKQHGVAISTATCRKQNFVNTPMAWTLIHGHLPELGIKYDPSHAVYHGGDYLTEASEWGHRIRHVHLKGALVVDGRRVDDPPAGMDGIAWQQFLSILRARGYDGGLSIEPHSDHWRGELEQQGIAFTVQYMNQLLGTVVQTRADAIA